MKKYVLDLKVVSVEALSDKHVLIKLTDEKPLPEILPGQFVEVRVDHSPTTMLRRPISINFVDRENNQLWLLVAMVGDGTRQLGQLKEGDVLNCMLPLGNGFTMPTEKSQAEDGKAFSGLTVWHRTSPTTSEQRSPAATSRTENMSSKGI